MAQKLLRNSTCILCRERKSSRNGEHVLRESFIEQFFPDKDQHGKPEQYSLEIGSRPELRRDGSKWTQENFPRVKVPCCDDYGRQMGCNNKLNNRFEQPAKETIRRLFSDGSANLKSNEKYLAGLWLLKTCLLFVHPEARQKARAWIPLPRWNLTTIPTDIYSWMVNGQPPPAGLSVWISKVCDDDRPSRQIALPTVIADGRLTQFQGNRCAFLFLGIDLVYHPGWAIEHPLEADGRAVRMWPHAEGSTVDIAGLPAVGRQAVQFPPGPEVTFISGTYEEANLAPITAEIDWMMLSLVPGIRVSAPPVQAG